MIANSHWRTKAALESNQIRGRVGDEVGQVRDAAINVYPKNHLGWIAVADLLNESNLLSGDIGPVFVRILLHLQQLMLKSKLVQLLAQLLGMIAVILIRCVERADYYFWFDHHQNLSPSFAWI